MHKFLRAVGFSDITKEELQVIFNKIIEHPTVQKSAQDSEGNEFAELTKEFGDFFGISLRGCYDEDDGRKGDLVRKSSKKKEFNSLINSEDNLRKELEKGARGKLYKKLMELAEKDGVVITKADIQKAIKRIKEKHLQGVHALKYLKPGSVMYYILSKGQALITLSAKGLDIDKEYGLTADTTE